MKEKSEVSSKLEEMLAEARTSGNTVKELLSDNGLEFDNEKVRKILKKDLNLLQAARSPGIGSQKSTSVLSFITMKQTKRVAPLL